MLLGKYERQLGEGKGFNDLERMVKSVPIAAVNDIAILAMNNSCDQSLNFLIEKGLAHSELVVRRFVVDYLCDLSPEHPQKTRVSRAVNEMVYLEGNRRLKIFALERYTVFQQRMDTEGHGSSSAAI